MIPVSDRLLKVLTVQEQEDLLDQINRRYWSLHRNRTLIGFVLARAFEPGSWWPSETSTSTSMRREAGCW